MTRPRPPAAPRIGFFGLFGGGNSGNEASLEAMLGYLRESHPQAVIDMMSGGFRQASGKYGLPATPLSWYERHAQAPGAVRVLLKILGKVIDPLRILLWVRGHDAVIVPGMGVLEDTTPVRAYGFPLSMFLLAAAGRACRVKVALVSVGASVSSRRATRFLFAGCARMASYRSYRDTYSLAAMRRSGVDTSDDRVFPDLAFGLPVPPYNPGDPLMVGVGVMDYNGGNDDRASAAVLHEAYVEKMTTFVRWLLENGYSVRFFGGDDTWDHATADEITDRVRTACPGIDVASRITAGPLGSYAELLDELNRVGTAVATRYHNVLGALKLCKPTIAIGYSRKFVSLMEGMGLEEFTQSAADFDVDLLIKQFEVVRGRRAEIIPAMAEHNAAYVDLLGQQSALLSRLLFDAPGRG